MSEVVISARLGRHEPGIVRGDDGRLRLTDSVHSRGGVILDDVTPHTAASGKVMAGRLPEAVARVTAIDDRGEEVAASVREDAWLAVSETRFSERLVRFADAAGGVVARPHEGGEPVEDADEPCPVCGANLWLAHERHVTCGRCGFRIVGPLAVVSMSMPTAPPSSGEDRARAWEQLRARRRREIAAALARVAFPVYAVAGRAASIGGYGGDVDDVDVRHEVERGLLNVESVDLSGDQDDSPTDPRRRLADLLRTDTRDPHRSQAANQIREAADERAGRRLAAKASFEQRHWSIDGCAEPFTFLAAGDAWVAEREHYGVRVTVTARGVEPDGIVLERLVDSADPERGTAAEPAEDIARRRRAKAGELLSHDQVAALIDDCRLSEHREAILNLVQAGYRLEPATDGPHRIGGLPDLADGEAWPRTPNGVPYTFVAQLDCAALAPPEGPFAGPQWRHEGALVRIFGAISDESDLALALACPRAARLTRAELPEWPELQDDDRELHQLHKTRITAVPFLTAPTAWEVLGGEGDHDAYWDFLGRLRTGGTRKPGRWWEVSQLLGWAQDVQGENPSHAGPRLHHDTVPDAKDWRVLLNIADGYENLSFGDGGALAIVAPVDDLARGRYDRLAADRSMG